MIATAFTHAVDWFFGRGQYAVTVPSMDGVLRPNSHLDDAAVLASTQAPDNVVAIGLTLFYTSGSTLWRLAPGADPEVFQWLPHAATALASSPGGKLAAALSSGEILLFDRKELLHLQAAASRGLQCITALAFRGEGSLVLTVGSAERSPSEWQMDLMETSRSGSVWIMHVDRDTIERLASNLAYPNGLLISADSVVVSEAWRHRLLRLPLDGKAPSVMLAELPGYPGRMALDPDGGAWLCIFAPRSQLIEFVLREHKYRRRMLRDIAPEYWIAPALSSGNSFEEPLQGGGVKQMGILKPWAPTRSYGLLIKLDDRLQPLASFHSRSDGKRHGITSVAAVQDRVVVTSRGGNALLALQRKAEGEGSHAAAH